MGEKESIISTKANTSTTKALWPEEGWAIAVPGCCSAQKAHLLEQHEHFSIHSSDWQLNEHLMNIWPCRERFTERFTCWSCRLHGRKSSRHETTRGQKSTQGYTRRQSTRTTTQHWVRTAHQSLRTAVRNHKQRWLVTVFFSFISLKKKCHKLGFLPNRAHHVDEVEPCGVCHDLWGCGAGRGQGNSHDRQGHLLLGEGSQQGGLLWKCGVLRGGCYWRRGTLNVGGVGRRTRRVGGRGVEGLGVPDPVEDDQRRKTK